MTCITEDTKQLIDYSVDFAEKMLKNYKEFFAFSVTINLIGDRIPTGYIDGNESLSEEELINKLETQHNQQLTDNQRRAYALTYPTKIQKENSSQKIDAIAIKIKHANKADSTIYYYAYRHKGQKEIQFLDQWSEIVI